MDAFPVWGNLFRLRRSDRGPGAVPFLIAMCHEPPHGRNGSSSFDSAHIKAHKHCILHRAEVEASTLCGCFYRFATFA